MSLWQDEVDVFPSLIAAIEDPKLVLLRQEGEAADVVANGGVNCEGASNLVTKESQEWW